MKAYITKTYSIYFNSRQKKTQQTHHWLNRFYNRHSTFTFGSLYQVERRKKRWRTWKLKTPFPPPGVSTSWSWLEDPVEARRQARLTSPHSSRAWDGRCSGCRRLPLSSCPEESPLESSMKNRWKLELLTKTEMGCLVNTCKISSQGIKRHWPFHDHIS